MPRNGHSMYMAFLSAVERARAEAFGALAYCNPFLPERIGHERAILGDEFVAAADVWAMRPGRAVQNPNVDRTHAAAERLLTTMRERLVRGVRATAADLLLYEDVAEYVLYNRHAEALWALID